MTPMDVENMVGLRFSQYDRDLKEIHAAIKSLENALVKLEAEMNLLRTQNIAKSKVVGGGPSTMTPFATRLAPVQPAANGGNKSPQ